MTLLYLSKRCQMGSIPDDCLIGSPANNSKSPAINLPDAAVIRSQWQAMQKEIEACQVSRKTEKYTVYSLWVCKDGQVAKAAASLAEIGDGLGYWLRDGKIRAVQFFHTGEVWFVQNGQLEAILTESISAQVKTTFSQDELDHVKRLVPDGHLKILQVFGKR